MTINHILQQQLMGLSAICQLPLKVKVKFSAQKKPLRPKPFYFTYTMSFYLFNILAVTKTILLSGSQFLDLFPSESVDCDPSDYLQLP